MRNESKWDEVRLADPRREKSVRSWPTRGFRFARARAMSALGQKQTCGAKRHVRFTTNSAHVMSAKCQKRIFEAIVLAQQSYCAGSLADWLHMGDVEECR